MFKVKVLTVGKTKEAWLSEALSEYEMRLKAKLQFEWRLCKSSAELAAEAIQEPFLLLLDPKGELLTSEQFSQKFFRLIEERGSRLSIVIGGAEGIPSEIGKRPHVKWSFSPLTFTHQIMRLLLAEQIYRALEIERGSAYHK